MSLFPIAVFALGGLALSWLLTGMVLHLLLRHRIVDRPNERSSHARTKPRGGGWALIGTLLFLLAVTAWQTGQFDQIGWLLLGTVLLAAVSWLDDCQALRARWRLAVQVLAVGCGLAALKPAQLFPDFLPQWVELLGLGFSWLWFLNLYNFMDGIDGITGAETATIASAVLLIALLVPLPPQFPLAAAALLGAALGFLCWNWAPSRLFLGDIGSVPLGFIIGWLLLSLAKQGLIVAAVIPMLYYGVDASLTLLRRLLTGHKIWEAHRTHFYQRALAGTRGRHAPVVWRIIAANLCLLPCAAYAVGQGARAFLPAGIIVLILMLELRRLASQAP